MMRAHPSERDFGRLDFPTGKESIHAATHCQCFSSSKSKSAQTQLGASDQAVIVSGGGTVGQAGSRIISLGNDSSSGKSGGAGRSGRLTDEGPTSGAGGVAYAEEGAVSVGGDLNTGLNLYGVSGGVAITGGAAELAAQNQDWLETLDKLTQRQEAAQSSLVNSVLSSVSDLAETKQTEGTSTLQKYGTVAVVAGLGVVAYLAYSNRK